MRSPSHFSMQIFCTQRRVDQAVVNTEETPKITGASGSSEDSRCNAILNRYGPCSTLQHCTLIPVRPVSQAFQPQWYCVCRPQWPWAILPQWSLDFSFQGSMASCCHYWSSQEISRTSWFASFATKTSTPWATFARFGPTGTPLAVPLLVWWTSLWPRMRMHLAPGNVKSPSTLSLSMVFGLAKTPTIASTGLTSSRLWCGSMLFFAGLQRCSALSLFVLPRVVKRQRTASNPSWVEIPQQERPRKRWEWKVLKLCLCNCAASICCCLKL